MKSPERFFQPAHAFASMAIVVGAMFYIQATGKAFYLNAKENAEPGSVSQTEKNGAAELGVLSGAAVFGGGVANILRKAFRKSKNRD